jgi:hypothetical protein
LDLSGSRHGPMARFCEQGNESIGYIVKEVFEPYEDMLTFQKYSTKVENVLYA